MRQLKWATVRSSSSSEVVFHCSCCGDEKPARTSWGETECCGKYICTGGPLHTFGTPEFSVRACCWGKAEAKFKAAGKRIAGYMMD